ncbi:MAG TPA: endolytic transglycosylase MltG [Acidimicrobiales bacterium]|nr:endolytic transglycosylase MltG [Acidimicrobiales bacterium]
MTTLYDDEAVVVEPMPEPRGGFPRWAKVLLALAVVGLLLAGAVGFWATSHVRGTSGGEEVAVEVPMGSSTQRIAAILDDKGVIENSRLFRLYVQVRGAGPFQAGAYTFREKQGYGEVVKILEKGPELVFERVTFPEGLTLEQIAARVGRLPGRSAERFLELARSGTVRSAFQPPDSTNLEGLLLAETYDFEPKDDELAILTRMVESFDAAARELALDQAPQKVGLSPYEAVIVASMVEEESKIDEERPKVAQVIYNRLQKGWPLGIDATIRYALNRPTEPLRKSDLANDNPYNTRLRKGLIPTPIAAPSRSALQAALVPEPGPWMYYVLIERDGRHAFAVTDAEFARYKAEAKAKGLL